MPIAVLSIDLEARLANLEAGFTKAQNLAQKNADQIAAAFKSTTDAAKLIGKELATAFSLAAIQQFIQGSIDAQDHMQDMAKRTQQTVEEIGGLGFAASQAGTDLDGVALSMGKLNQTIAKAAGGNKAAVELFEKMGIAIRDANGQVKSSSTILLEVTDKWKTYEEGPLKAALANALFSKGYASMLPLLEDGGGALRENVEFFKRFGGVSTESARAADQFNDTVGKIKLVAQGTRNQIINELIDPLQAVADAILKVKSQDSDVSAIASGFRTLFETVAVTGANVLFVLGGIGREAAGIAAQLAQLFTGEGWVGRWKNIRNELIADGIRARKELDDLETKIMDRRPASVKDPMSGFAAVARQAQGFGTEEAPTLKGGEKVKKATKDHIEAIESLIVKLREQVAAEKDVTDVHKELHKAEEALASDPRLAKVSSGARLALLGWADAADKAKNKFDEARNAAAEHDEQLAAALAELKRATDAQAASFAALLASTPTEKLKVLNAEIADLQERFDASSISAEQFAELLNIKLGLTAHDFAADWKTAIDEVKGQFEGQFADTLVTLFHGTTKGILDSWANMLQQMVAKALAAKLGEALFANVSGSSVLGQLVGFFSGISSGPEQLSGPRASGGNVNAWSSHPVNERGIEAVRRAGNDVLLVGSKGGRVVPNNMLGGGPSVVVNFQITSGVSRNELASMIPALTANIKAQVQMSMRRPGFQGA